MAGEWTWIKLGDVCTKVGSGATPRGGSDVYLEKSPYALIRSQNIYNDGFHHDGLVYISEEHAAELEGVEVMKNDVLLNITGDSVARVCQVDPRVLPARVNQHVAIIRPDPEELDPRFLRYVLVSPGMQAKLLSWAGSGGTRNALTKAMIESLEVLAPEHIPEQRAIAHILGTLDDKIEVNRRMSRTLEEMARALFKSWFIDFDPVRRNAARARNQPSPPSPLPRGEGRTGEGAKHVGDGHYRGGYDFSGLIETARELRRKQTPAEEILWQLVRGRRFLGLKFRRQHQIGDYITDFYCHEHRLVIEFDGGVHSAKRQKDHKRDAWMKAQGYTVLRFPNEQLLDDPTSVLCAIARVVESHAALPSLFMGEEQGQGSVEVPPSPAGRRAGDEGVVGGAAFDHLFPNRFVDSELGEIPEGWEVGIFGDIVEQLRDNENPSSDPAAQFLHFSIPAFDHGQWPKLERGEDIKSQKLRVVPGVVLLSKLNPEIERVWLVDVQQEDRAVCSTEFLVLHPLPPYGRSYVYCAAQSPVFRQGIEGLVTGTSKSHQRAQAGAMLALPMVKPPEGFARAFELAAAPLLERTLECRCESRTLAALCDALLAKLISGEIRVKDAEQFSKERGVSG